MKTLFDCETEDEAIKLIDNGADVNERNGVGQTPLFFAAQKNLINVAITLLDAGADVNAKDQWGDTPLHIATINGYTNVVRLLLLAGADVNAKDNHGCVPIDKTVHLKRPDTERVLRKAMNKHEQDNNTIKTKTAQVIPMQKEQEEYKKVMSSAFHELRRSTTARKLRLLESILEAIYHLPSESDEAKPLLDVARGAIEELNGGKPVTREDTREIVVGYEDEDCIVPTVYNKDYPYHVYANERDMMNLITRKQHDLFRDHPDDLAELFEADRMVTYIN